MGWYIGMSQKYFVIISQLYFMIILKIQIIQFVCKKKVNYYIILSQRGICRPKVQIYDKEVKILIPFKA